MFFLVLYSPFCVLVTSIFFKTILLGADPEGEIAVEGDQLIEAGAAGAFVHGLEDEYMEVRSAAIGTLRFFIFLM